MAVNRPRTIKLYCPSLSKIVQFMAWEEQRLDLGSIAGGFGLEPSTLKLNSHFISRGVDLISTSVTWKSLLSFFSSKGLPTGKDNDNALIVDGKLSKVGTKRVHEPEDAVNGFCYTNVPVEVASIGEPAREDINLLNHKRRKESSSGCEAGNCGGCTYNGIGFKRKQVLEELSLLKKLKIYDVCTDMPGRGNEHSKSTSSSQLRCSSLSGNMKRMREDEAIVAAPYKRIR
ncbi:hypothetical protein FNV43_RR23051 [Rhamnella rubrinervis]|uniref:Uncharacterized protein n=1 Tax=Rhamnella rubrinervis TaxID=2594499 RepID=A0A8K0DXB6_9ROSA|nr:hypothetical protein FNV43_RR23051 [Rhamnella rubrinervis]